MKHIDIEEIIKAIKTSDEAGLASLKAAQAGFLEEPGASPEPEASKDLQWQAVSQDSVFVLDSTFMKALLAASEQEGQSLRVVSAEAGASACVQTLLSSAQLLGDETLNKMLRAQENRHGRTALMCA